MSLIIGVPYTRVPLPLKFLRYEKKAWVSKKSSGMDDAGDDDDDDDDDEDDEDYDHRERHHRRSHRPKRDEDRVSHQPALASASVQPFHRCMESYYSHFRLPMQYRDDDDDDDDTAALSRRPRRSRNKPKDTQVNPLPATFA